MPEMLNWTCLRECNKVPHYLDGCGLLMVKALQPQGRKVAGSEPLSSCQISATP